MATTRAQLPPAKGERSQVRRSTVRKRIAAVAVAALSFTTIGALQAGPAVAATPRFSYAGTAYGTSVSVGTVLTSGRSAPVDFGCTINPDLHRGNTIAGVNLGTLGRTGTVSTTGDTSAAPVRSATTANTAQLNLLGGLVRATAIKAASSTTRTTTGYTLSSAGTTLSGLVIGGRTVRSDAAPNTRIDLAGIGHVIVNEQIRQTNRLTVTGLHLFVTVPNVLGIAVGSNVTISQAVSGLAGPVAGVLGGYAYGSRADAGSVAVSGPSFNRYVPCLGTGGTVWVVRGAALDIGTAVRTATIANSTVGSVTTTAATVTTTSTVQAVDLLNGLVKATAVKASARASLNGTTYGVSSSGSSFGSLSVVGHAGLGAKVAPNTTVKLAGVGTLYLHRVIKTSKTVEVRMIELVLTSPVNGLAAGTVVRVGVARSTVS